MKKRILSRARRMLCAALGFCLLCAFVPPLPASASSLLVGSWVMEDDWGDAMEFAFNDDGDFYFLAYVPGEMRYGVHIMEGTYAASGPRIIITPFWSVWYNEEYYEMDQFDERWDFYAVIRFSVSGDTLTLFDDGYGDELILTRAEPSGLWDFNKASTFTGMERIAPGIGTASEWAYEGINEAYAKGFIPPEIRGDYRSVITRREFCRMAVRWVEYALGKKIDDILEENDLERDPDTFTDTADPDILAAYALGITAGTSASAFSPNGQFTREQAATMIRNACRVAGADAAVSPVSDFADLNAASAWARDGINFVREYSIMSGTSTAEAVFSPSRTFTREQSIITFNNIDDSEFTGVGRLSIGGRIVRTDAVEVDLFRKNITDISLLSRLDYVKILGLDGNNITDISPLSELTSLERLGLGGNKITDISPLGGLTNLEYLNLSGNNINDISPLGGLTNLKELDLCFNSIRDISALGKLTNLESLCLWGNNVSDISALNGLTNLEYLDLDNNNISDISPLKGLTNLKVLYISYNPLITQEQVDALKEALPDCRIYWDGDWYWDDWDDWDWESCCDWLDCDCDCVCCNWDWDWDDRDDDCGDCDGD